MKKPTQEEITRIEQELLKPMKIQYPNQEKKARTPGWIYVPSIKMEFAQALDGLGLNWYDCHKFAREKGCVMPTPRQTWELIFYLKENIQESDFRKVYDSLLKKTPKDLSGEFVPQENWCGEWQNAFFVNLGYDNLCIRKVNGINQNGNLDFSKPLEMQEPIEKSSFADIRILENISNEGLCIRQSFATQYHQGENIFFTKPIKGSAVRFRRESKVVSLDCDLSVNYKNAKMGVRFARYLGGNS